MKKIATKDSTGMVLSHDLTKIVPGEFKGPAFKKGHVIKEEDIPELLKMGKEHIYVWEPPEGHIHEDEAAGRIAKAACGPGLDYNEPREGKISFKAKYDGLLKVNREAVNSINSVWNMCFSTLHDSYPVQKGKSVAATRVIPLTIDEKSVAEIESLAEKHGRVIEVKNYKTRDIGIIISGNEVYYGRVEDAFAPTLQEKFAAYGYSIQEQVYVPDDPDQITASITKMQESGRDLILACGGMSVDPDDNTPGAIKNTGAEVITYGSPVLPGAMFMMAELGGALVLGLPACVIFSPATILDIVLPRILAGEKLTREDITSLGVGGYCQGCSECRYPACGFGKC